MSDDFEDVYGVTDMDDDELRELILFTAEQLLRDTTSELSGTGDMSEAIERGFSCNPPTEPVQEGSWSKEDH